MRFVDLRFVCQDALSSETSSGILIVKGNLQRRLGIASTGCFWLQGSGSSLVLVLVLVQMLIGGGGLVDGDQVLLIACCPHVAGGRFNRPSVSAGGKSPVISVSPVNSRFVVSRCPVSCWQTCSELSSFLGGGGVGKL